MSSFSRVEIDKLNINWDEIYRNKSDAKNNTNNVTANQDYWGDQEGLSVEIHDDGTVLIYEGDTPMGWTTLEALGLDENGNQAIMDYSELTADDIPEGQYVACTQNGIEGYAILVDGKLSFISKNTVYSDQNGHMLFKWSDANGTSYIFFDENTGTYTAGLSEDDIKSYANDKAFAFTNSDGRTMVIQNNVIQFYEPDEQFTVGDNNYIIPPGPGGIYQINSDGTISLVDKITLPDGSTIPSSQIKGTAEYNGEKVVVVGNDNERDSAMIISADGSNSTVPKSEFPDLFEEHSQETNSDTDTTTDKATDDEKQETSSENKESDNTSTTTETSSSKNSTEASVKVDNNTTAKYDKNGELVEFTHGSKTYEKIPSGYQTTITSQSGENYKMRYDSNGNFVDVIDSKGNRVIYKNNLGLIQGQPIDDGYMSFNGINDIIANCKQASNM